MSYLAVGRIDQNNEDEFKIVSCLKQCIQGFEAMVKEFSEDMEASQTFKGALLSSKDWVILHYYLADSLDLVGSYDESFKFLSAVQNLQEDSQKTSSLQLKLLKDDRFTKLNLASLYWELYLRVSKARSHTSEIICALLKLLKLKEKTSLEKDAYRMDLALMYEKDKNPQMAIKYYQIISSKSDDSELKLKAKKRLNDLLNDAETRSANISQSRRPINAEDKKETVSSRSYRSGNRSVGKNGQANCIIFTPSVKAKRELNDSKADSKDSKSAIQSTDESRSEQQKLVFKQKTPSRKSSKQNSPLKEDSFVPSLNLRGSYVSEGSVQQIKDPQNGLKSDRSHKKSHNESVDSISSGKLSVKPEITRSPKVQTKISMAKADKQPTVVNAQKIASKPKTETPSQKPTQPVPQAPKKEVTSPSRAANPKYFALQNSKKTEEANHKKTPSKPIESREPISKGSKERIKESDVIAKKPFVIPGTIDQNLPSSRVSTTKNSTISSASGNSKSTANGNQAAPKVPQKKGIVDIPKKVATKSKDIMNSPEMKTKLKVFDVMQFRPDETFGTPVREKIKPKPNDDLLQSIEAFLIRILTLTEEKKFEEAETFLQKYRIILDSTHKDSANCPEHQEFERFLEARIEIHKGSFENGEILLMSVVNFFRNPKNVIEKLPAHKAYFELADLYAKQFQFLKAIETYCSYLQVYNGTDCEGTLAGIKQLFTAIEQCSQHGFDRLGVQTGSEMAAHNQIQIIKKLEDLETLSFRSIRTPIRIIRNKRLECLLVLSSAYLMAQLDRKAEDNLDKFLQEVDVEEKEHIGLIKEMFESLLAANRRNLALKYIKKMEGRYLNWPHEHSDLYLAMVCTKLGLMSKNERKFSEGLFYFEMSLDFFKKLENIALATPQEESNRKKFFAETLLNIALCCYEIKEYDRSSFFNKKAEETLPQNTESMSECYLLFAKLKFQRKAFEDSLEYCRQSYDKGDKMVRDRRRVCEMYYLKGKCYQELRKKDKAFEAFKSARKIVEYIKDPYLNEELKNKIDDAFLNFH